MTLRAVGGVLTLQVVRLSIALFLTGCSTSVPHDATIRGPTKVAITFDDLPYFDEAKFLSRAALTARIVAILHEQHIPATYGFSNGASVEPGSDGAEALALWRRGGNLLANHTFSHADINSVSVDSYLEEIARQRQFIEKLGQFGTEYFRYPYLNEGNTIEKRSLVRRYLAQHGYRVAPVSIDFSDWAWDGAYLRCVARHDGDGQSSVLRDMVDNALEQLHRARRLAVLTSARETTHILLLHHAVVHTKALSMLLAAFRADGVQFVTLEEALSDPVYDVDTGVVGAETGTFFEQLMTAQQKDEEQSDTRYPVELIERICSS